MKQLRNLLLGLLLAMVFSISGSAYAAGTPSTVTSLMKVLAEDKATSVYNMELNAPFSKESSGVRENISTENGELSITNELINVPGRSEMDLSINITYRNRDAKIFDERTKGANTTNSYGTTIIAVYDVFDANGFWLRTGALQYPTTEPTILANVMMGAESWVFTGYLQYESGTSLITASSISNFAGNKSLTDSAKYIFGTGWSLDIPTLMLDGTDVYVTLINGHTYKAAIGTGIGLVDYELTNMNFNSDSTVTLGGKSSAYKLYYTNGDSYYYSSTGQLICQKDKFGNQIAYEWIVDGGRELLSKVTDSLGRTVDFAYNGMEIVITSGERTVHLYKELVPGQTNQYYLSRMTDLDGQEYCYEYDFSAAHFDALGKTAATNTYVNLKSINYPSGAKSTYTYLKATKNLGLSGFMEYFKILSRQDESDGKIFDRFTYEYGNEPDGYPTWKADSIGEDYEYRTTMIRPDGLSVSCLYNSKHQLIKKETLKDYLLERQELTYSLTNLQASSKETSYNDAGESLYRETTTAYDERGNVTSSNYHDSAMDPASNAYLTTFAYSNLFDMMTKKEYFQDENTKVREEQILTSDGKSVTEVKIFANDSLERWQKRQVDSYGNIMLESTRMSDNVWATTEYEYGAGYLGAYLTRTTHKDVRDAAGASGDITNTATYDMDTGRLKTSTDGEGYTTEYYYDKGGRITETRLPDKTGTKYAYDDVENAITVTDPRGNKLVYDYDSLGKLLSVLDGNGANLNQIAYDSQGQPISSIDANGNQRKTSYDETGRICSVQILDSAGTTLSKSDVFYDEAGKDSEGRTLYKVRVIKRGTTNDQVVDYLFDSQDRLVVLEKYLEGNPLRAEYVYNYLGSQTEVRNVDGTVTKADYNPFGEALLVTDPAGVSTSYEYDDAGNCTGVTDGMGNTVTLEYDEIGRTIKKSVPFSPGETNTTQYFYDDVGNLVKEVDPEEKATNRYYSETGKLLAVEQVRGPDSSNITKMEYDESGNLLRLIQGLNGWDDQDVSVTAYTYDQFGHAVTKTDPAGNVTAYVYDLRGNLVQGQDRNQVVTHYDYDGLNRLTKVINSKDGEAGSISYAYDMLGNRTQMKDAAGIQNYMYDDLSRLTLINYGNGIEERYSYDLADRISSFVLSQGTAEEINLAYEYDPAGRTTAVSDQGVRMASSYDSAGRLILEENGFTGISTNYSYNPMGNLTALLYFNGETLLDSYEYSYDKRGNQTSKTENGMTTTYSYDPLSRIKTVEEEGGSVLHYEYTDTGDIASVADINPGGIGETLYSYDISGHLLLSETTTGDQVECSFFEYDPEGNQIKWDTLTARSGGITSESSQELLYNGFNRLTTVIDEGSSITAYLYNGDGLRTSKDAGGEITRYVYDRSNIVLETDGDYRIRATNVRNNHQLLYRETEDNTYFYQFNGHGDVTKLRDLSGMVVRDYSYDPYGNEDSSLMPSFGGSIATTLWQQEEASIDNPFRYCGEYLDETTGFYYLRARDYAPSTQRFLTEDSYSGKMAQPLSLNLYTYCANNPVNLIDPSGNTWILPNGNEGTDIDRQLLAYKSEYENAGASQRSIIAKKAANLRAENPGGFNIQSGDTLDYYLNNSKNNSSEPKDILTAEGHYARNSLNKLPCDELWFYKIYWNKQKPKRSIYHGIGIDDSQVKKFLSPDGHLEAVFYGDKLMILDSSQPNSGKFKNTIVNPVNAGTYNYGITDGDHLKFDVVPYYAFGNSKNDTSYPQERLSSKSLSEVSYNAVRR